MFGHVDVGKKGVEEEISVRIAHKPVPPYRYLKTKYSRRPGLWSGSDDYGINIQPESGECWIHSVVDVYGRFELIFGIKHIPKNPSFAFCYRIKDYI